MRSAKISRVMFWLGLILFYFGWQRFVGSSLVWFCYLCFLKFRSNCSLLFTIFEVYEAVRIRLTSWADARNFWLDLSDLTNPNLTWPVITGWLDLSQLDLLVHTEYLIQIYLTGLDQSWLDLTCPNLMCSDLTCPESTYSDLYPDFVNPVLPDYHPDIQ